jgi:hypothetical protein
LVIEPIVEGGQRNQTNGKAQSQGEVLKEAILLQERERHFGFMDANHSVNKSPYYD